MQIQDMCEDYPVKSCGSVICDNYVTRQTIGRRARLQDVCNDLHDMYLPNQIQTIQTPQTDREILEFYRCYVAKNIPVKITGAIESWPALHKWHDEYLISVLGRMPVTTAVTPNGLADAVVEGLFTLPFQTHMPFIDFCTELSNPREDRVLYLQKQNSSFTDEFKQLMCDVDMELPWASKAFGTALDAVNFWMGDGRAVTSLHKDPYENIYCVVRGEKTFTLFPPTDRSQLKYKMYPVWKYNAQNILEPDLTMSSKVPWIDINQRDPLSDPLCNTHPVTVTVAAGETLYLPSFWFHHVQQTHGTIAVNYWYDIDYGPAYGVYSIIDSIVSECADPAQ